MARAFKNELRQELGFPGWTRACELDLERATRGWLRSTRASNYVLSHPVDGTVSLVNAEIDAGDRAMQEAIDAIRVARDTHDPEVDRVLREIREGPVQPVRIPDAQRSVVGVLVDDDGAEYELVEAESDSLHPPSDALDSTPAVVPEPPEREPGAFDERMSPRREDAPEALSQPPPSPFGTCTHCRVDFVPGEPVLSRLGALLHIRCDRPYTQASMP